jgi:sugar phosphate isomerase/epimerase
VFGCATEEMPNETAKQVRDFLDGYGMTTSILHSSIGKVEHPENKDVFEGQMRKARRLAAIAPILGTKLVRIFPLRPDGVNDFGHLNEKHRDWDRLMSLNEPLFRFFADEGLEACVENAAFHINDALNIVKGFSPYHPAIAFDTMGSWILRDQNEPVDDYFTRVAPYVRNIHAKAFALPQYRDHFEMPDAGKTAGVMPWGKLMRKLREAKSTGPLSVETQQVLISGEKCPNMLDANKYLAEFALAVADED